VLVSRGKGGGYRKSHIMAVKRWLCCCCCTSSSYDMIDFGLRNILRRCAKFCEGRLQKSRNCLRSRGCIVTVIRVAVDSDFIGCSTEPLPPKNNLNI